MPLIHTKRLQQNSNTLDGVHGRFLCLLDLAGRKPSVGFLNISLNIGKYFLNIFIETAKFRSSFSILARKSCGILAMSAHALLFVKNSIKGKLHSRKS